MKILLPENISEITVGQFQEFESIKNTLEGYELEKKTVSIFTNISFEVVENFPYKEVKDCYNQIVSALDITTEFQQTFILENIEFGFHPNLDHITGAEWTDLERYQSDIENYHRLMAILYRPIINKDKFGNYEVEKYNGTSKHCDLMKKMPLNILNGLLVFFYSLANELNEHIMKYMAKERMKDKKRKSTLKNGAGIQQ